MTRLPCYLGVDGISNPRSSVSLVNDILDGSNSATVAPDFTSFGHINAPLSHKYSCSPSHVFIVLIATSTYPLRKILSCLLRSLAPFLKIACVHPNLYRNLPHVCTISLFFALSRQIVCTLKWQKLWGKL